MNIRRVKSIKLLKLKGKNKLAGNCEVIINTELERLSKLEGKNKKALETEFREWINAIESDFKSYDALYIYEIN